MYRLYVDESGDHIYGAMDTLGSQYLGLTGCAVELEHYATVLQPEFEGLKHRYFRRDPDDPPIVLHRNDLVQASGSFAPLINPKVPANFDDELITLLAKWNYRVITIVIDKKAHLQR